MKKSIFAALSIILSLALLAMPMVVSASTAVESVFDPVSTMWYSVDFVRTSAANAADDAYVYDWTPAADGELTLAADTECKDAMITVVNSDNKSDAGVTYKYNPAGGFTNKDGVTYKVNGGDKYKISVMSCTGNSGTVSFFAYFTSTSDTGLAGAGTYSDPYLIDSSVKSLPAVGAGKTIYYLLSCDETKIYNLKVRSANTADNFELYVENNKLSATPVKGIATVEAIIPYAASSYIMFSVTNNGTATTGAFSYLLEEAKDLSTKGTLDDPAALVLDTPNTAKITTVCYYYSYTPAEDGVLSVSVESESNWVCSISGGSAESAYCAASDTPVVNPVEYPVNAGDEIILWVATEEFGAGTVSFTATLKTEEETTVTEPQQIITTAATEPQEVVTTVATEPQEDASTVASEPDQFVTTAPAGEITTTSATNPAEITTAAATEPVESKPADGDVTPTEAETSPSASAPADATSPTASAPADTAPTASEPATGAEVTTAPLTDNNTQLEDGFSDINEEYCLSPALLQLGDNQISVSSARPYTLFEFTPGEYAEYTFTASDANAIVGAYAGTINYIPPTAVGTSNSAVVAFSSGMDIIVAVGGTTSCTLTVEKTGDVEIKEEDPWTVYENVVDVVKIQTDVDINKLTNVMIYDEIANSAVLGSDGYYHLDSANGEILYVDLNSYIMSFIDIVDNGKLCAVFYDENGNVTEKIDFTSAIFEYIENAAQIENGEEIFYFYPLTADLIEMYQVVGKASDWYGRTGWVGGIADDAWMFGCYYEKGVTTGGNANENVPVVTPGNPSAIPTGRDFTIVYVAAFAMLLAAVAVVIAKKKTA